jgi:hypothetical protein
MFAQRVDPVRRFLHAQIVLLHSSSVLMMRY